jgi:hypothetical protein
MPMSWERSRTGRPSAELINDLLIDLYFCRSGVGMDSYPGPLQHRENAVSRWVYGFRIFGTGRGA